MRHFPIEPNKGEKITASFIRELCREIRANAPLAGYGTKIVRTPNGTHIISEPPAKAAKASRLPGCFDFSACTRNADAGTVTLDFERRYYRVGGKTWEKDPDLQEGETSSTTAEYPCIIGFTIAWTDDGEEDEIPNLTYASWADLDALKEDEKNMRLYCVPLYSFDEDGALECDFRNAPAAAMGEFE